MSEYAKAAAEFWSAQGKAMLHAQETATRSMTDGMHSMLAGYPPTPPDAAADLAQANEEMKQLWSAAAAMSGDLAGKLAKYAGGKQDGLASTVFERIADPRQWLAGAGELDDVLARMAEGPRLADLWDIERRSARVMTAWTELRRRTIEHQRIVLEAWLLAGRRYAEELAEQAGAEAKPLESKRAFALWTELANRQLLKTQRSEPFLASQRALIRASTELRLAQQDMVEQVGKQYGFPTRTELDDVHRSLTEMRRELRRLRRALADTRAATPPPRAAKQKAPSP